MHGDDPLAYLITWTVYGTFLQGDQRGWRRRCKGNQSPQPKLVAWRQTRLKHPLRLLTLEERIIVEREIDRLATYRGWGIWSRTAHSNHVHVVVSAPGFAGAKVRDQFKANGTRVLRCDSPDLADRPVWTVGGDWKCVNSEEELERAILYVREAQDRKHQDDGR